MNMIHFYTRTLLIAAALVGAACTPLVNRPSGPTQMPQLGLSYFTAADGGMLPVRSWMPSRMPAKAVIVALHGFNDYSFFFNSPGGFLSGRGYACYAYDQRGFGNTLGRGLWAGVEAYVDDLKTFTVLLRRRHPDIPLYILGESMGGAVAIVAMASTHPPETDGLILSSPAVWGRATMPWYQRVLLESLAHTMPWLQLTGEGLKIMASDNIEMLRQLGRDPVVIKATRVDAMYGLTNLMDAALDTVGQLKISTLVLYGEHDQIIPLEPVMLMLEKMPESPQTKVAFYENGYHMLLRDLQADKPWGDIAAWIENREAQLPSGADRRVGKWGLQNYVAPLTTKAIP